MARPLNRWYTAAAIQETPDGYWRLDDTAGSLTAVDQTYNGNDGTVNGTVTFGQSGWSGDGDTAALFNGTTGFVNVGNVSMFSYAARFSVAVAFKSVSATTQVLVSKSGAGATAGWSVSLTAAGNVRFSGYTSGAVAVFDVSSSATNYADGNFHWALCTYDPFVANLAAVYVDGVQKSTATPSGTMGTGLRLLIGAYDNGGAAAQFFNGTLDEVAVYAYTLSAAQDTVLYAARNTAGNTVPAKYARAAVGLSYATRSGYYATRPIALLGGVDLMTPSNLQFGIRKGTLQQSGFLGTQPRTAQFTMWFSRATDTPPTGSYAGLLIPPAVGTSLVLADGAINNPFFRGTVVRVRHVPVQTPRGTDKNILQYDIEATDGQWLLNRRTVTKQYAAGLSSSAVVTDIVSNFTSGFTANNVQPGGPMLTAALKFKGAKVAAALTQVTQSISPNWNWRVDQNSDVHFALLEVQQRPSPLQPGLLTYWDLDFKNDITQIRTRMQLEGGGATTQAPVAIGDTVIPVDECGWYLATGGTVASRDQGTIISYTGVSAASGAGNLTGVTGVIVPLLSGDVMHVWVTVDDAPAQAALAALEGGDGIHEQYLSKPNNNILQCTQAGNAELAAYGDYVVTGTVMSYDRQMTEGKTLSIRLGSSRHISLDTTIQQVVRTLAAPNKWVFKVTFGTVFRNIVDVLKRVGQVQ